MDDWGEEGYCKILFRFKPPTPWDDRAAQFERHWVRVIKTAGWQVKVGTPPKTNKERKLAAELQKHRFKR